MIRREIIVDKSKSLLKLLQDEGVSYADAVKILKNKDAKVNGRIEKQDVALQAGDEVVFYCSPRIFEKKLKKVYENEEAVIIFKRAGIESEGMIEQIFSASAVHRLDRNTEGLMVFAKTEDAKQKLEKAFRNQLVHKLYLAEVVGEFQVDAKFDAYLLKNSETAVVTISQEKKKNAVAISTGIKTLKAGKETSLLQIELFTGKTHQIRAHLAFLGHPIVGDGKYGRNEINKKFGQKHQKLCCFRLKFDYIGIDGLNFQCFEMMPDWLDSHM